MPPPRPWREPAHRRSRSPGSSLAGRVAGDLDAVDWLVRAADETVSIAPSAAIALYDEALALAPDLWDGRAASAGPDDRADRVVRPVRHEPSGIAASVLDADPTSDVEYEALRGLSAVYGNRGDIPAAIATIERAVALARPRPRSRSGCAAWPHSCRSSPEPCHPRKDCSIGAKTLADGVEIGDATTQCLARQVLGCINLVTRTRSRSPGPSSSGGRPVRLRQGDPSVVPHPRSFLRRRARRTGRPGRSTRRCGGGSLTIRGTRCTLPTPDGLRRDGLRPLLRGTLRRGDRRTGSRDRGRRGHRQPQLRALLRIDTRPHRNPPRRPRRSSRLRRDRHGTVGRLVAHCSAPTGCSTRRCSTSQRPETSTLH